MSVSYTHLNSSKSADGLERHVVCSELVNRITKLQRRHRVVIVGAGFGGLAAAKALRSLAVEVVLVDERNHHTFQPLLYQVATAGLDADDVTYATRGIFHRQRNATVVIGSVTGVDFDERLVDLDDGRRLAYDHLILAPGAVTHTFGVPGVAEHAFGLKSVRDAVEIRSHVLACVERADGDPLRIEDGLLLSLIHILVDPAVGRIDTLPWFRRTIHAAGLEAAVVAVVGDSPTVARFWSTPLALVFIDGGHGDDPAHGDYERWSPHVAINGLLAICLLYTSRCV